MDKFEYKIRSEEILNLYEKGKYIEAAQVADDIDWRRVRNIPLLARVAEVYRFNRRNEDCRDILKLAYNRNPANRSVVYSLCEVSIELDDVVAAIEYYKEFVKLAPRDMGVFTLRYKILEAQEASLEERIELLEELKKRDYQEEWAYELAYLYHRVGLATKCVEECDDLILWFGDGTYVMKALELKMLHAPLTPIQEKKYAQIMGEAQGIPQDEEYLENDEDVISYSENNYEDNYENAEEIQAVEESPQEEEYQEEYVQEPPKSTQQTGDLYGDLSKYHTINFQKVVAESMRELYPEDEDMFEDNRQDIARIEEYERASGKIGTLNDEISEGILEVKPEPNTGAIKTVFVPDAPTGVSIAQAEYASVGMEYNIPQKAPEVEEEKPFRPMTGQMNINEVLGEWERMKKANEEKRKEGIRQLVLQQTGKIFKDFDESINSGILGELKQEEQAINEILPTRIETYIDDETEEDLIATGRIDFDEAVPVAVAVNKTLDFDCDEEEFDIVDLSNEQEQEVETSGEVEQVTLTDTSMTEISFEDDEEENEVSSDETALEEDVVYDESEEIENEESEYEQTEYCEIENEEPEYEQTEYEEVEEIEEVEETQYEEMSEAEYEEAEEVYESEYEEYDEVEEIEEVEEDDDIQDLAQEVHQEEKDSILKTREIIMNTAEIGSLSDKILATTTKETQGSKQEVIREFTEEESDLFDDFAVTKRVKKQILSAIEDMTLVSYKGNVIITGDAGLGTLRLAKNLIKVFKTNNQDFSGKVAKITGEQLNNKSIDEIFDRLRDGALIIEDANGLLDKTVYDMISLLNQEECSILLLLIDTRKGITKLTNKQAMISDYFTIRIDLAEMDNNALVAYAQNYALELEYSIDELGLLALHTRIANVQTGHHVVTKDEVRGIIDEAIWKSKRSKLKNFVDILLSKRYDQDDMIVLKERDFM